MGGERRRAGGPGRKKRELPFVPRRASRCPSSAGLTLLRVPKSSLKPGSVYTTHLLCVNAPLQFHQLLFIIPQDLSIQRNGEKQGFPSREVPRRDCPAFSSTNSPGGGAGRDPEVPDSRCQRITSMNYLYWLMSTLGSLLRSRPRATQSFSSWSRGRTGLRMRALEKMPR